MAKIKNVFATRAIKIHNNKINMKYFITLKQKIK